MKKTLTLMLCLLLLCCTIFLASCDLGGNNGEGNYYTKSDVAALIDTLEEALESNTAESNAKIAELEAKYAVDLAALQKADGENKAAIEALKADLATKTQEIKDAYDAKITSIEALIAGLTEADIKNVKRIATLEAQMKSVLEQPVHTYGNWKTFKGFEDLSCDEKVFYRVCSVCGVMELKSGTYDNHNFTTTTTPPTCTAKGYDTNICSICGLVETANYTDMADHDYKTAYSHDSSYHWYDCKNCSAKTGYAEHDADDNGICTSCEQPLQPTAGIVYYVPTGTDYAEVIDYTGTATKIMIADTYQGVPVTKIGDSAFKNKDSITMVVIPASVKSIGEYAFYNCSSLTSINIPASVTSIGEYAFYNCSSLETITFAEGSQCTSIGEYAFYSCSSLTGITIPASVTSIGKYAFYECSNLAAVYITDLAAWCNISFKDTYSNPLYYAHNLYLNGHLVSDLVIPAGVTRIGSSAFHGCSSLETVTFAEGSQCTSIGNYAFYHCSGLTSINIPASVTSIGDRAFYYCSKLIKKENGVSYVDKWAVDFDDSLAFVTLRENTVGIAAYAFYRSSKLRSITIPASVTGIGYEAFEECSSLETVTFAESSQLTSIGSSAFKYCQSLTSIIIPASVTSISSSAFWGCGSLRSITYQGTVAEWMAISKGTYWNLDVGTFTITCTDGTAHAPW